MSKLYPLSLSEISKTMAEYSSLDYIEFQREARGNASYEGLNPMLREYAENIAKLLITLGYEVLFISIIEDYSDEVYIEYNDFTNVRKAMVISRSHIDIYEADSDKSLCFIVTESNTYFNITRGIEVYINEPKKLFQLLSNDIAFYKNKTLKSLKNVEKSVA